MRLDQATVEEFAPFVGHGFAVDAGEAGALELELVAAIPGAYPAPEGARQPFTLKFLGPGDPILPQRIYRLDHERLGAIEIFIVPVARDEGGTSYEAVFN